MKRLCGIALAALMLLTGLAQAEESGALNVYLKSLGERRTIHLTVAGEYAIGGEPVCERTELALHAKNGGVWISDGAVSINAGKSVRLQRGAAGGLYIAESEKKACYDGSLTVSARGDRLRCVLEIGVEDYLCGVVGYEMSDSFPIEALKAQAVAARTYAMRAKARGRELVDTAGDQVFKGRNDAYENVLRAVEETRGVVGKVGNRFAECYYTASNGGMIATPEEIWGGDSDGAIEAHEDPYDLENPRSLVSGISFQANLSDCAALRRLLSAQLNGKTPLGVLCARVDGRTAVFIVLARGGKTAGLAYSIETVGLDVYDDLKDGLSIGLNRRDCERASIHRTDGGFAIEMRGFGHCAGMSQRGAQQMAGAHGKDYCEILAFYYPNMALETLEWAETPPLVIERAERAVVTLKRADSHLNLRQGPGENAAVIGRARAGSEVSVRGEAENGWIPVRALGVNAWARAEYLRVDEVQTAN